MEKYGALELDQVRRFRRFLTESFSERFSVGTSEVQ
jgi:hypothetical protein